MTNPRHLTVAEAFELLGQTLAQTVKPLTLSGTIRGLRRGSSWSRCELITFHDSSVSARLPIAIPPSVKIESPDLEDAAVEVVGRFEVHPLYGPLQFVAANINIIDPIAASVLETEQFLAELHCVSDGGVLVQDIGT